MITEMFISEVETEFGFKSFAVESDTLQFFYPDKYSSELDDDQFFFLSLQYLEEHESDVVSTDSAKLEMYRSR